MIYGLNIDIYLFNVEPFNIAQLKMNVLLCLSVRQLCSMVLGPSFSRSEVRCGSFYRPLLVDKERPGFVDCARITFQPGVYCPSNGVHANWTIIYHIQAVRKDNCTPNFRNMK